MFITSVVNYFWYTLSLFWIFHYSAKKQQQQKPTASFEFHMQRASFLCTLMTFEARRLKLSLLPISIKQHPHSSPCGLAAIMKGLCAREKLFREEDRGEVLDILFLKSFCFWKMILNFVYHSFLLFERQNERNRREKGQCDLDRLVTKIELYLFRLFFSIS